VNGGSGTNNTLSVTSTAPSQAFNLAGTNSGNVSNTGVGGFNFTNIQNIAGGNNTNVFSLGAGSLDGTITGGTGNNTLIAGNGNNVWTISGNNSGAVTGINGFSQIQNITGGSSNNTFSFTGNGGITGALNGNSGYTNTLDYSGYGFMNITMTSDHGGLVANIGGGFQNINNLMGNGADSITIANASKTDVIHITGALKGYVNDPSNFDGFNTFISAPGVNTQVIFDGNAIYNNNNNTAVVNGMTLSFINIQHFTGKSGSAVTPAQNQAIVSSTNSASNNNSASGTSNSASVISGANDTGILMGGPSDMALQISSSVAIVINDDLTGMTNSLNQTDLDVSLTQAVSTNCS
jgi:hypothetical protein